MITRTAYKQPSYNQGDTIHTAPEKASDVYAPNDTVSVVDTLGSEIARWRVVDVRGKMIEAVVEWVGD